MRKGKKLVLTTNATVMKLLRCQIHRLDAITLRWYVYVVSEFELRISLLFEKKISCDAS